MRLNTCLCEALPAGFFPPYARDRYFYGVGQFAYRVIKFQNRQAIGYTASEITYAILKKALDNTDITRDGLFNAFESLVIYGSSSSERVPRRDSIVFAIDPTQPTGIKPLTPDFTGTAAKVSHF